MRTDEIIKLMPTQYRRVSQTSSLYTGHSIPRLGYWTKDGGYVKLQSLRDDNVGESLACPIIAVVSKKLGNKDLTLTITGKKSQYKITNERSRGEYTITKKVYEPTEETITADLTIPRYTRPYATFLITGLGKMCYEISSIADNVDFDVGRIEFFALASNGSKIIYWLGIHNIAEEMKEIMRPWVAPTTCSRCLGTGIEPNTTSTTCKQCLGYKYDGYSSNKYVQRKLGIDVGLARKILDWDNLTDEDHVLIRKFINKAWTQKWWVTPTVKEIRRLLRHFYILEDSEIEIYERFHNQEPVWKLFLPLEIGTVAPFGQTTEDRELLKYIAETITPAGVSVFVGFFKYFEDLGDFDGLDSGDGVILPPHIDTSMQSIYALWGTQRWMYFNGWQDAIYDFEQTGTLECSGMVDCSGAFIVNANDRFRHVCMLDGMDSYFEIDMGTGMATGCAEVWVHPSTADLRFALIDEHELEVAYVDYDVSENAFVSEGVVVEMMSPESEKHLRMCWEVTESEADPDWAFATDYRREITFDDGGERQHRNLLEIDMGTWIQKPNATDWSKYVRLTKIFSSGIYKATYNFERDAIGSDPDGWIVDEGGGTIQVIDQFEDHSKVVECNDNNGGDKITFNQYFSEDHAIGTIEFWLYIEEGNAGDGVRLLLREDGTIRISIAFNYSWDTQTSYYDGVWHQLGANTYITDKWNHIKIEFDVSSDWHLWINGVSMDSGAGFGYSGVPTTLDQLQFHSGDNVDVPTFYVDAVGYSWDPDYSVGDNLIDMGGKEYEIKSQTYDNTWSGGNHNSVSTLINTMEQETTLYVYYGDKNLGNPNYSNKLSVTENSPNAGDYTIQQDEFYKLEIWKNAANDNQGGIIGKLYTRVSGSNVEINRQDDAGSNYTRIGHFDVKNDVNGYGVENEQDVVITKIEDGDCFVAFKVNGTLEDPANNKLQDDSGEDVTYEIIYIFMDSQLIQTKCSFTFENTISNIQRIRFVFEMFKNGYFDDCSYKYGSTHWVGGTDDKDWSAGWSTKKYMCLFDTTTNDGIATHFIDETLQRLEDELLMIRDAANFDAFYVNPDDSNDNDNYSAGTESMTRIHQIDDFTEADGNNDDDGDQPAHRKSQELQASTSLTVSPVEKNYDLFNYDILTNIETKGTGIFTTNPGVRKIKFYNKNVGKSFIDAIGFGYDLTGTTGQTEYSYGDYTIGDNVPTLAYDGWGIDNVDYINGEMNILQRYFRNDKPIKL